MKLAVTGATGFVGSHLLDRALAAGHTITALTRRDQSPRDGVTWVRGDLADEPALRALADGADAIIHVAGVLTGSEAAFEEGNVAGTVRVAEAAQAAGVKRFAFVSSLAAREPDLSRYGASKARAEAALAPLDLSIATVRPPAVYGPGDRETLDLFRMAKRGLVALPPSGRLSLIHADDLADLLLALAASDVTGTYEPDDGRPRGWTHREFAAALGSAVGKRPLALSIPSPLLQIAALGDELLRGDKAKLTRDRARYFCHPDWVVAAGRAVPHELWTPRIASEQGLADTARWYEREGWL